MPAATYEELLIATVPQVIETEAQYRQMVRQFGDLAGKGRARSRGRNQTSALAGTAGGGLRSPARTPA